MQAEITFLTRRGAAVMQKSRTVTADQIRFGRGTDNEVPLADLRVALSEAALEERAGRLFIAALGSAIPASAAAVAQRGYLPESCCRNEPPINVRSTARSTSFAVSSSRPSAARRSASLRPAIRPSICGIPVP